MVAEPGSEVPGFEARLAALEGQQRNSIDTLRVYEANQAKDKQELIDKLNEYVQMQEKGHSNLTQRIAEEMARVTGQTRETIEQMVADIHQRLQLLEQQTGPRAQRPAGRPRP